MHSSVKIALVQMACSESVEQNQAKSIEHIRKAASQGAKIVGLQELYYAQYFPQYINVESYRYAHPLPSPLTEEMAALAKELRIVLILPVYEEAQPGVYFNSVVAYGAEGEYLGKYRKTHIPDGPQYLEKYYFTPGDLGYPIFDTPYGKIAVGICWDEWYPEVARIFALQGAQIIFYPSAIGSEPDRPDYDSSEAWRTVIRAHGITNGVFIAASNRVGTEGEMSFYGKSFISDPFGEYLAQADGEEGIIYATCNFEKIRELRDLLHFFRDRRIDTYAPILKRSLM